MTLTHVNIITVVSDYKSSIDLWSKKIIRVKITDYRITTSITN
jgi:hypothetical protein